MKYLLFILLNYLIIFVNCKLQCEDSGIANYQLVDGYFGGMGEFISPVLSINNFLKFDSIEIKPDPIYKRFEIDTSYEFGLDYGVTYEITCLNNACTPTTHVFTVTTKSGPRFIATQPSCNGSYGYIDFNSGQPDDTSTSSETFTFQVESQPVTLPYQVTPNMMISNTPITITAFNESGVSNTQKIYFSPSYQNSNPIPTINVVHPTCDFNGEIHVPNHSDYSSVTVRDEASNLVTPSSNGVYTGLGKQTYTITTESTLCGKQVYTRELVNVAPYFKIVLLDNSCPANALIKLDVNTTLDYEIILDEGNVVSQPFYYNLSNYRITLSMECGQYLVDYSLPQSFPPVHYIVEQTDYCTDNYTITVVYNSTLVPDLIINRVPPDMELLPPPPITLDSNNSFLANMHETYQFTSKCFTESIEFGKQYPKPAIQLSHQSDYCTDFIDVYVYNWLDFEDPLSLQVTPSGESVGNFPTYQSVNGLFKNVSNQLLTLTYNYRGCGLTPKQMEFGNRKSLTEAGITLDIDVDRYPSCYYLTGNATVTLKKTSGDIISVSSKDFSYFYRGATVNFYDTFIGECGYDKTGNKLNPFTLEEAIVSIETINKTICKYSTSGGFIKINANAIIDNIWFNGNQGVVTYDNIYEVGAGSVTIEIDFDRDTECFDQKIVYFVESIESFEVQYTTASITDCKTGTGVISIVDYSSYTTLQLDSMPVEGPSVDPVTSGYHSLQFEKLLSAGQCSGKISLYVPTSIDVDIGYSIIRKPLCELDAGGYIHFDSIVDRVSGEQLLISSVGTKDSNSQGKSITGLYAGDHVLTVSNGTCSWQVPVTLEIDPVVINYQLVSSGISNSCRTMGSIKFSTDNEFATSYLKISDTRGYQHIGLQIYGDFSTQVLTQLSYGVDGACIVDYEVRDKFTDYNGGRIEYTILKYPPCNSIDQVMDIQILNYKQFTRLTISGISMGVDGTFRNIVMGQYLYGDLIYQGCQQISTWHTFEMVQVEIPGKKVTDETCWGSKDGVVDYSDESNYYYSMFDENSILLPLVSKDDTSIFSDATAGPVQTYKINKNNPTCFQYEQFNFIGNEPVLQTASIKDQCTVDGLGSVDIKPSIVGLSYQFNLTEVNFQQQFIDVANVPSGNYSVHPYMITSNHCKRLFNDIFYVSVGSLLNKIELNIQPNTDCDQPVTVFTPVVSNTLYHYTVTTPSNQTTTYQQIGTFTLNSTEIGNYSLSVSSGAGNCLQLHTFTINECISDDTDDKDNNLGLKVGLPIGLVALSAIVAATLLLLRKRKRDITKAKGIDGVQHEMNTVSTFQGGHIVNLDKF